MSIPIRWLALFGPGRGALMIQIPTKYSTSSHLQDTSRIPHPCSPKTRGLAVEQAGGGGRGAPRWHAAGAPSSLRRRYPLLISSLPCRQLPPRAHRPVLRQPDGGARTTGPAARIEVAAHAASESPQLRCQRYACGHSSAWAPPRAGPSPPTQKRALLMGPKRGKRGCWPQ